MTKKLFFLIATVTLLTSCGNSQKTSKAILPEVVDSEIELGMTLSEFNKVKSENVEEAQRESFRIVFLEKMNDTKVSDIVYYFDSDDEQVLYEIIIVYKEEAGRDAAAKELFGEPNHDEKEWRLTRPESFNVWAWPHKTKLVVVGMFPGTEWFPDNWN